MQDYDLAIRVQLPQTFSYFEANPITFNYKTATTDRLDNKVRIALRN